MAQWTPLQGLRDYSLVLGRKVGYCAIGWLVAYFVSLPFRPAESANLNVLALFAPLLGAIAGVLIGWYMATDAVEDSGLNGFPLWAILVGASWLPMLVIEWLFTFWRSMQFGGWMMLMAAMVMSLAAAVWHETQQE